MNQYYTDLHIHIGRTKSGRAVKITGAKSLTFSNIIDHARDKKGLNMIGIIDCHSPEVILEMEEHMAAGELIELAGGGLSYGGLTIIPGSELEIYDENCHGPIHVLCFFADMNGLKRFSGWLEDNLKNIHLSSQRIYVSGKELQYKVKELGGLFIPAHVFTPFKSLYGKGVQDSLTEVFNAEFIDAIELGLSSDTYMADGIRELHSYTFISNSDAHSLGKIAREYQTIAMNEPTFEELRKALSKEGGRRITANYGLDPLLGKYHQTACEKCQHPFHPDDEKCENCGHHKYVKGVADRIAELSEACENTPERPPYIHQIPLEFIPGLGPKMREKLLDHFGTEMAILHEVSYDHLKQVVPQAMAERIIAARTGTLQLAAGGAGKYGKVM
ncbi:endonuclease Q family protein [Niallia endozanthoxylica]|uniref:TIGR00375 family protein n=1 Tax=Niallia endozanthoxylica TaxID=2036016 RepID=A0A5J5HV02_9BACI|nr:endonuclease Q family protein [Niallia endozanthoxylica]KAA9026195.1 TIGR00375 family protein [Niallia endozanthoxylica]